MPRSVNQCNGFILNHLSQGPPSLFTPLRETKITHLGTERNLVMIITMNNTKIWNFGGRMSTQLGGEKMNMQLGGERMNMQLGGWTEAPYEEKILIDDESIIKGKDILKLKMMLEAT